MRDIFGIKTGIQIPIHLMLLAGGQVPARFQIKRQKLNFLQYILHQSETSTLYQMLMAQKNMPKKGDWYSECMSILKEFDINLSISEITSMDRKAFRKLTKSMASQVAYKALISQQLNGKKGVNIKFTGALNMAEYLRPNSRLTLDEQKDIFAISCEVNNLPCNVGKVVYCVMDCGQVLSNSHIMDCEKLNNGNTHSILSLINGNVFMMKEKLDIWKNNIQRWLMASSQDSML